MATKIVTKNSSTASAVPTASDLVQGELAVNVADKRLFTEDNTGTIVELGTNPSTIDINAGSIDGTAIGASSASTGAFTTLTATGLTVDTNTLYVDSTNNRVGIGTTSPSVSLQVKSSGELARLETTSSGGNNYLAFYKPSDARQGFIGFGGGSTDNKLYINNDENAEIVFRPNSTEAMRIDSSGNVGIGTSSPDTLMHLSANTGATLTLESTDTAIATNEAIGTIDFFSNDASGIGAASRGSISLIAQDAAGAGSMLFKTSNASSASTERVRIDSSGNVGIGTTSPSRQLYVQESGTGSSRGISINTATAGGNAGIGFATAGTDRFSIDTVGSAGSEALRFYSWTASAERMRIDSSGNVGINRTSPNGLLHMQSSSGTDSAFYIQTSAATDDSVINFGDDSSSTVGKILYAHSDNSMRFTTDASERMRIDSSGNVGIGTSSPSSLYTGANNLVVGGGSSESGMTIYSSSTTDGNIYFADGTSGSAPYSGFLEYNHSSNFFRVGVNASERMRIDSSGNLLVGKSSSAFGTDGIQLNVDQLWVTNTSSSCMSLNRKGTSGSILNFYDDGSLVGSISTNANSLPSDRNFKRNIKDLTLGLDFVSTLKPVTYNYKIDDEGQAAMAGLIAQEVEESLTAAGVEKNSMTLLQHKPTEDVNESDYQIDYLKFVPILINSIKEQQTLIESLTARIAALEE